MKRLLVIIFLVAACGSTTPSPSGSPRAAATPAGPAASDTAPQPSASAGPAFVGEFPPIEIKGKGNKDVTFEIPEDSIAIASLSHPAKGAFNVGAYDEDGKLTQQLVKVNGKYAGTVLFDLETHSVAFKVPAKGPWKITIKPAEAAKAWDGTKATQGQGRPGAAAHDTVSRRREPAAAGDRRGAIPRPGAFTRRRRRCRRRDRSGKAHQEAPRGHGPARDHRPGRLAARTRFLTARARLVSRAPR